jgi:endonuclease/exonuclease/phosphatase (EEP) superfamily protein YafD
MIAWLRMLVGLGLALAAVLTSFGWLAHWSPTLDIVNNGLPGLVAGTIALSFLALLLRDWRLVLPAIVLAAVNIGFFVAGLQGAAQQAPPGSERFLRVVTFNVWGWNDRIDDIARFLRDSDADALVLQEVAHRNGAMLRKTLQPIYPFTVGETELVILSKHPILAEGRVDRPGFPNWNSLMLRWVRLDVKGTSFELVGVHLARPLYPTLHEEDFAALTNFVLSRTGPLVVAGDFNMTPWTKKLARFTRVTGLERYNTFHLTWPMRRGRVQLLPLIAIDNVFASRHFAKIAVKGGPRLGSDHKPVIADLALAVSAERAR